ncbi:MAG: hypothetical protein K6A63_06440 [Acholeplasmatales bacterium]|nr:hypothetical protein [Acholeplasmatales bacterium]
MKKTAFILLLISFLFGFNAYAEEVKPDTSLEFDDYFNYLAPNQIFNYLIVSNDDIAMSNYEHYNNYVDFLELAYNNLTVKADISFYDSGGTLLKTDTFKYLYVMGDCQVDEVSIYIGDTEIFYLEMGVRTVTPISDDFYDLANYCAGVSYAIIGDYTYTLDEDNKYFNSKDYHPKFLYSPIKEEVEEVNISIDISNPLSKEDIAYKAGMIDSAGNSLADYEIINSNYDPNNLELSNYYIRLRSYGDNTIYLRTININITDMESLINTQDIEVSYDSKLTIYDILAKCEVGFEYKSFNVTSDYFYSYNKLGEYSYIIYFTDLNDNTYYGNGLIKVVDNEAPHVDTNAINANQTTLLERADILSLINVYDDYDGKIADVQLNGYVNYLKQYDIEGEYEIEAIASDSTGNIMNEIIIITVGKSTITRTPISSIDIEERAAEEEIVEEAKDTTIIYSDYIINSYTDHKLSMSEIQDLLISEGLLSNDDIVTFSGEYFDLDSPNSGQYEILLTYISGKRVYYEISNSIREVIVEEEEADNTNIIIFSIIGGIVLVGVVTILIIRRKTNAKRS